jgi:hypothetical protein
VTSPSSSSSSTTTTTTSPLHDTTYLPHHRRTYLHTMTTPAPAAWQQRAAAKREAILAAIPSEWRLASVPSVQEQVDVTTWIEQFFSPREREITACSAAAIAAKTCTGAWSAEEVARAFCHRAAVAHQLVCVCVTRYLPIAGSRARTWADSRTGG